MTSIVNGFKVQKSTKTSYDTGQPCDCFSCTAFTSNRQCDQTDGMADWEYGHEACCFTCPNKRQCAKPDPKECFIGIDSHQRDPVTHVTWNGKGPNLRCVFDVDKINTMDQIDNFKQTFGIHGDYNAIVANYCQQSSSTCITDPDTGKSMTKCSRLKSTGKDGELCRGWFNQQPKAIQDTVVQNYCTVNNTPDCKCVNRAQQDVYKSLKVGKVINDGCWYTPCANPQSYLQTTDVEAPSCPDNFCDVIYNIVKDRDVTIDNIKNDVNCVFQPPPKPPPKPPIVPPPKPPIVPPPKPPIVPPQPMPQPTPKPPIVPPPKPPIVPPPKPPPKPPIVPPQPMPQPTPKPPQPPTPKPPVFPPLNKNYLLFAFAGLLVALLLFKSSREVLWHHKILSLLLLVLLGVNAYGLQKFLNEKF